MKSRFTKYKYRVLSLLAAMSMLVYGSSVAKEEPKVVIKLKDAFTMTHRSEENRARDSNRKPGQSHGVLSPPG